MTQLKLAAELLMLTKTVQTDSLIVEIKQFM